MFSDCPYSAKGGFSMLDVKDVSEEEEEEEESGAAARNGVKSGGGGKKNKKKKAKKVGVGALGGEVKEEVETEDFDAILSDFRTDACRTCSVKVLSLWRISD
jgi:hypothetical protein